MPPAIDETFMGLYTGTAGQTYSGVMQTYTVSVTGNYEITAFGAQGGAGNGGAGGEGAEASADITLTAGTVLDILVGGQGASADAGGGGGGSFVVAQTGTVALVVGGGGGGGGNGDVGAAGGPGLIGSIGDDGGAAGGDGGGGGGGFASGGGAAFPDTGGTRYRQVGGGEGTSSAGYGGYGGGGGAFFNTGHDYGGGGGGGGYSGGVGGTSDDETPGYGTGGGGGGSYVIPTAHSATEISGVETGNGEVIIDLLCFLAGTAIATPGGELPIEALRVGDLVLTEAGHAVPLTWIGRRSVTAATKLDRDLHYPVRIRRDAVAPGIPRRDLLVTGDHTIFVDGHLIPARMLVNGGSIRAERAMTTFTYFHLELEHHDLLLAEGLPAESYLDTGNRHMFADGNVVGLAPPSRTSAAEAYAARGVAPLSLAPELVEPVWRRLAARAAALGIPPVAPEGAGHHGLHLLAGERRILPIHAAGDRALFVVPPGVREAVLVSGATRPADTRPWLDDRRRLGVKVSRVRVHADGETMDVALDGPILGGGWHGVEPAGRWTGGSGVLALRGGANVSVLELTIAGAMMERPVDREAA
jgi:hypothetical protein